MKALVRTQTRYLAIGAVAVGLAVLVLHAIAAVAFGAFSGWVLPALAGIALGWISLGVFVSIGRLAARIADWLSADVLVMLFAAGASFWLLRAILLRWPGALLPGLLVVVFVGQFLLGAGLGLALWKRGSARIGGLLLLAAGVGAAVFGLGWLASPGSDPFPRDPIAQPQPPPVALTEDPAGPGPYRVRSLLYGSGADERRAEYGEGVDLQTDPVDLGPVLPEWRGFRARHREWWWGFGISEAPRNGRLQLPEVEAGDLRPLVLIVHGNHGMQDFSDGGYEYLTTLLASHGIAAASVDANFLNGAWSGDFGGREMPARAILLLEHLRLFRDWNRNPRTPVFNRLDLDRVALLGHSRGGEAAAIAAAFNALDHFPDDTGFAFDYGFGIESVVAIAQIDRRYSRRIVLEDINFLAIQGSYDTDEPSFHGLRQFHRTRFSAAGAPPRAALPFRIKAGVVFHRGNHGQFNTTWGMDSGLPGVWWLNRAPLIPASDQQRAAAVYVSAFLRATLLGERRFLPLLRDWRAGSAFLPETLYQNQYRDSLTEILAGYEEDLDVRTATAAGSTITASGFAGWSEEEVHFRDGSKAGTSAVRLRVAPGEGGGSRPAYEIGLAEPVELAPEDDFVLSVVWNPRAPEPPPDDGFWTRPPLGMTVQLRFGDREGREFSVADALSPEPPFEVRFLKSERMDRQRYRRTVEEIPQTIAIPAARLLPPVLETPEAVEAAAPAFPAARLLPSAADNPEAAEAAAPVLTGVQFRFDPETLGEVVLDDIGIRRQSPADPDPDPDRAVAGRR